MNNNLANMVSRLRDAFHKADGGEESSVADWYIAIDATAGALFSAIDAALADAAAVEQRHAQEIARLQTEWQRERAAKDAQLAEEVRRHKMAMAQNRALARELEQKREQETKQEIKTQEVFATLRRSPADAATFARVLSSSLIRFPPPLNGLNGHT